MSDKIFDVTIAVKKWDERRPQLVVWEQVVSELTDKFRANLNYYKGPAVFRVVMEVTNADD